MGRDLDRLAPRERGALHRATEPRSILKNGTGGLVNMTGLLFSLLAVWFAADGRHREILAFAGAMDNARMGRLWRE
jgi:hypothetical protein